MSISSFAELRIYEVEPGRMADMQARYHGPLRELFSRHVIEVAGAWHSTFGPRSPLFVYLMHWESLEARQQAWNGFYADPQWHRVRSETNRGSELVERYDLNFLRPITPLSAYADADFAQVELCASRVRVGAGGTARQWIEQEAPQALASEGGQLLGAYEHLTGNDLPRVSLFVGWRNPQASVAAVAALAVDPLGRADRYLLQRV